MSGRQNSTLFVNGIVLVISIFVSLAVAELLAAIIAPSTIVEYDILGRRIAKANRGKTITVHEGAVQYHDWQPNQRGKVKWLDYEYQYEINSLSLRDSRDQFEEWSSYRILVLGDSQTYGWGLSQDQTFTFLIEEILEKVSDLKAESTEKDEVIGEQMRQVSDLESKVSDLELKILELEESSGKADELMDKLAEALG